MLSLLALAVAPGAAIAVYIYSRDKYDREPFKPLLISFILGMLAIAPAVFLENNLRKLLYDWLPGYTVSYYAWLAFALIAVSEEGSKFIMLRLYAYRNQAFNEPFDGIIYSVMISMGFATFENIGYVLSYGFTTGIIRMFLSVPSHAAFGVLMGYQVGMAKFDKARSAQHMTRGLLLAILFHGAFDFFLLLQGSMEVKQYLGNNLFHQYSNWFLTAAALIPYLIAVRMSLKSIRLQEAISKQTFIENQPSITEV